MIYITVILFYIYRFYSLKKEIRIWQLNHYQFTRMVKYVKQTWKLTNKRILKIFIHIPFFVLLIAHQKQNELFLMMLIVYLFIIYHFKKGTQNTLIFTRRVLRLCITLFFLYYVSILQVYESKYFIYFMLLVMSLNTIYLWLASIINYPIEKAIQSYYKRSAKKIMKENRELMKIGIVGSYGKTSTKNILYAILSRKYLCLKSQKSYNNMMGNVLTIRNELKRIHELFICEMGSDHVGEIRKLMQFVAPQYAIITSIGNQHMETFKTQDNIIKEKTTPIYMLEEQDIVFLNIDDKNIAKHKEEGICQKVTFGESELADYRLCNLAVYEWGSRFSIIYKEESNVFETTLLGYYNVMNICGSIALSHTLGVPFVEIQNALLGIRPIEHRLQSIQYKKYTLIDNAYNSNILSFKNSLEILKNIPKYRILITPGLVDLKEDYKINKVLLEDAKDYLDEIVIVGYKNRQALLEGIQKNEFHNYKIMDTMEEALYYVDHLEKEDFVVLIENDIDKDIMNVK